MAAVASSTQRTHSWYSAVKGIACLLISGPHLQLTFTYSED